MFSVLFEVHPGGDQWEAYLGYAKMLRPELEQIDGFVDNIRYRSLTRDGWILSLSGWDGEKALVRWRTRARHHEVQEKGRTQVLSDYHLRVGQVPRDTHLPDGHVLAESQRRLHGIARVRHSASRPRLQGLQRHAVWTGPQRFFYVLKWPEQRRCVSRLVLAGRPAARYAARAAVA